MGCHRPRIPDRVVFEKLGLKRWVAVDANGIQLGSVTAPANRHDSPLLVPTLEAAGALGMVAEGATVHLDRGYNSEPTRERLRKRGLVAEISAKGKPKGTAGACRAGALPVLPPCPLENAAPHPRARAVPTPC